MRAPPACVRLDGAQSGEPAVEQACPPAPADERCEVDLLSFGGVTWASEQRADMRSFACVADLPTPNFRTPAPRTMAEALASPDAEQWQRAIKEEVDACMTLGVWSECDLPPGKQALPSHFIFTVKRDGRFKARLVAGGHRQQYGLDFDETYASVCTFRTMRMVLAIAARWGLTLRQFDIRTAYLNAELGEEVYMHAPPGLGLAGAGRVLRL